MAKKRQRATQTSKGVTHQNPKRLGNRIQKELRREYRGSIAESINKITAHRALKRVYVTIENPNTNETNKRFVRVLSTEAWGYAKK